MHFTWSSVQKPRRLQCRLPILSLCLSRTMCSAKTHALLWHLWLTSSDTPLSSSWGIWLGNSFLSIMYTSRCTGTSWRTREPSGHVTRFIPYPSRSFHPHHSVQPDGWPLECLSSDLATFPQNLAVPET